MKKNLRQAQAKKSSDSGDDVWRSKFNDPGDISWTFHSKEKNIYDDDEDIFRNFFEVYVFFSLSSFALKRF